MNNLLPLCVLLGLLLIATTGGAQHDAAEQRPVGPLQGLGNWELITEHAAFSPRDTAEPLVYDGKMWAIKGGVWTSTDGVNWTQVLEKPPFGTRGHGEVVVFQDKIWHLTSGDDMWNTSDGVNWKRVATDLPYGKRGACAVTVYDDKLWVNGGRIREPNDPPETGGVGATTYNDVWCSEDGVN